MSTRPVTASLTARIWPPRTGTMSPKPSDV